MGANFVVLIISTRGLIFKGALSVELLHVIDVPGSLDVELAVAADVDEVVGIIAKHSPDGEWPFPWRRELVHALPVLDELQDEIALLEGASADSAAVVAAESLMVD
jgi:hypothetical protein